MDLKILLIGKLTILILYPETYHFENIRSAFLPIICELNINKRNEQREEPFLLEATVRRSSLTGLCAPSSVLQTTLP